jgi:L-rhamnose mutarotase
MTRFGALIRLRPAQVDTYRILHAEVWPHVLGMISACGIRNYTIFLREPENLLFAYYEYVGSDHAADMRRMAADPVTREWWTLTEPCQIPLESRDSNEWWASMEEVFHHD